MAKAPKTTASSVRFRLWAANSPMLMESRSADGRIAIIPSKTTTPLATAPVAKAANRCSASPVRLTGYCSALLAAR
ncbi:hypothetical protein [Nocardia abscessus]|uniref:hypothetical protein n=1 Tax=Nocardia abscessus TaxID=120957 RepID=UPI002453DE1E|nr:hypothetical protein [Nocardia abscessus]